MKLQSLPQHLMMWGTNILVETANSVALFSGKGTFLWEKKKAFGLPFAINGESLYYITTAFKLNDVTAGNKERTANDYIPEAPDNKFPISLLVPRQSDFLAVVQSIGGVHEPPPEVFVHATDFGSNLSTWELEFGGTQRMTPLFIPEKNLLWVFMQEAVLVDGTKGTEVKRIRLPMVEPLVASADAEGNLFIIGVERHPVLAAVNTNGDVMWKSQLDGMSPAHLRSDRYPPVLGAGKAFVVSDCITAIQDGRITWTYHPEDLHFKYATAFQNGSLVAAGGSAIALVTAEGRRAFSIRLPKPIVTPPLVTDDGMVVIATEASLIRIE